MTENEAIEVLKEKYITMSMCLDIEDCKRNNQAISNAITALEEIRQYRALGTVEDIKKIIDYLGFNGENDLIDDMNLFNQYRILGTVEELRKAIEKQRTKKPASNDRYNWECPICGAYHSTNGNYCSNCGQAIWSE